MAKKYTEYSDNQLIQQYLNDNDTKAFEALVRRHYDGVRKRLLVYTKSDSDADDLSQSLWIKVLEYLPSYKDDNKFQHFLNKVATNLLRDRWRKNGVRNESSLDEMSEKGSLDALGNIDICDNPIEREYTAKAEVEHLTKELIPQLPANLRMIFLLKHESEYWDDRQPFKWQHLAELNDMEMSAVWQHFQSARDKLVWSFNHSGDERKELTDEELQIFLVWTQTQRVDKSNKYTEQYFADLLNIPVNTFKTHYRKAIQFLSQKMTTFSENSGKI